MSDIFLSYASPDRARITALVQALVNQGWTVWWDRTILPGKRWDQVIEGELDQAKCVIVVWSKHSVESEWVQIEADEAKRRGILVPALLDDVRIPLPFRRIQAANLVDWSGDLANTEFETLCRGVRETFGASARSKAPKGGSRRTPATLGVKAGVPRPSKSANEVTARRGKGAKEVEQPAVTPTGSRQFDPSIDGSKVMQWASDHKARNAWDMGRLNFERCKFDLQLQGGVYHELVYDADGYLKYQ